MAMLNNRTFMRQERVRKQGKISDSSGSREQWGSAPNGHHAMIALPTGSTSTSSYAGDFKGPQTSFATNNLKSIIPPVSSSHIQDF
jgi:hypothetical protein